MTSLDDLEKESQQIYEFCSEIMDDDIQQATEKGNYLSVYINRTGRMLAEAKYHLNSALNCEAVSIIKEVTSGRYSAKIQNALIDSVCKRERYIVDQIEQLNKTCKYQLEWSRTVISKIKEEMKYNNL